MYPGNDIQGWMRVEELQWLFNMAGQMQSIVEVGVWKGRATHALLSGGTAEVLAVDTWETTIHGHDPVEAHQDFLRLAQGFPQLTIMRLSSLAAARVLDQPVDMVFIDADHSYEAVRADILAWRTKARKLICGHDYKKSWPGVQRAVQEIFGTDFGVFKGIWFHNIKS
ncbi:MAG: class I SAM-dependent methyltransferase [Syntrophales bacterium]|nr:class I SAM-dependent methyltransferase [Syntrophales bacterium]